MKYRSIILELNRSGIPVLNTIVSDGWGVAQTVHDALRDTVLARGSSILYASLLEETSKDNGD